MTPVQWVMDRQRTIKLSFKEMAPLSLTVADVRELDDGGGLGHNQLPVAAGNGFSCQPVIIGKIQPASFEFFLSSLCAIPVSLFA